MRIYDVSKQRNRGTRQREGIKYGPDNVTIWQCGQPWPWWRLVARRHLEDNMTDMICTSINRSIFITINHINQSIGHSINQAINLSFINHILNQYLSVFLIASFQASQPNSYKEFDYMLSVSVCPFMGIIIDWNICWEFFNLSVNHEHSLGYTGWKEIFLENKHRQHQFAVQTPMETDLMHAYWITQLCAFLWIHLAYGVTFPPFIHGQG